jgi:hypothetical protein
MDCQACHGTVAARPESDSGAPVQAEQNKPAGPHADSPAALGSLGAAIESAQMSTGDSEGRTSATPGASSAPPCSVKPAHPGAHRAYKGVRA